MKTCSTASVSVNGLTMIDVVKQKKRPNVMEMGRAGRALRVTARSRSVKQSPWNESRV